MIRDIHITAVLNGFIVKVGCQRVVYTSVSGLLDGLHEYYANPTDKEVKMLATSLNSKHIDGIATVAEARGEVHECCGASASLGASRATMVDVVRATRNTVGEACAVDESPA